MADKLDFMTELAKDVDARKHGQTSSFGTINDFVPKNRVVRETDYDREQDYENTRPVSAQRPVYQQPQPQTYEQPRQEYTQPQPVYEPQQEYDASEYEEYQETPVFTEPVPNENDSEETRPASFHEEERVKIEKPKFRISPALIGGVVFVLLLIGFLIWFLFFRANIMIPDFTGKTLTEAANWAKQNKIDTNALARTYEYSTEYDNDVIISQTPEGGTRIKTNTPITFIVSQGADPEEPVDFPDIKSMTYSELNDWKNDNKLTKTKISTEYNTAVEKDAVISYELKNVSESEFKRGSTLTIKVSKGPAPAGQVTVENFVGKSFADAATWANTKKVVIVKQEINSDKVESGYIISQQPASGQAMAEGETFTVTVSKGKGVKIPNLVGYSKEQLEAWSSSKNNNVTIVKKSIYNTAPLGSVIAQDPAPGTILDAGDVLQLTISLYMPILETNSRAWLGKDYLELKAWCDDVNYNGADIQAGMWGDWQYAVCSDEYPTPGQIIEYACYYGTSDLADGCGRPLNNYSRINMKVSSGACTVATPTPTPAPTSDPDTRPSYILKTENIADLDAIMKFCNENVMACDYTQNSELDKAVRVTFNSETHSTGDTFQSVVKKETAIKVEYK
ncbi:MAG: PASTA domain-containing protein [Solobacterium sp.]|nr:PASTA domain-containing protein [Solobacterium sp.]